MILSIHKAFELRLLQKHNNYIFSYDKNSKNFEIQNERAAYTHIFAGVALTDYVIAQMT